MNKILYSISAVFAALFLTACDPVDENERFSEATDINQDRKVLVQEFTGQLCPNCPLGHEALDNIKKQYGKNAVIVSIHAGDMAYEDEDYGLKTPEGDIYAMEWGIQQYPSAVINRKGAMADRSQWQGAVLKAGIMPPTVKIELSAQVNNGALDITADITSDEPIKNARYQVWIVEDNITALQQDGEDYIMEYVHNHVYRASPLGTAGLPIENVDNAKFETKGYSINSHWNPDNLSIVAFVYTDNDVLQAEEVKVVK